MALPPTSEFGSRTTRQWGKWFFDLLAANPAWLHHLFRPASLEELLGAQFNKLSDDADRSELAIPVLRRLLGKWLAGKTLAEIEEAFGTLASKIGKCKNAREFVLRTVPELAYAFGLPGLVARASQDDLEESTTLAATLMTLGSCVREGLDSPEKLALRQLKPRSMTRVGVHLEFERVSPHVGEAPEGEDFDGTMVRIRHAVRAARAS